MKRTILLFAIITSMCSIDCKENCTGTLTPEACTLTPESGPCEAAIPSYYYDQTDGICKEFFWGGCNGVRPFETLEACEECECNTP